jgi:hypothetical protein
MATNNTDTGEPETEEHICALCHQAINRREGAKVTGYDLHFSCAGNLAHAIQKNATAGLNRPSIDDYSMTDLKDTEHVALIYGDELQLQHAISEFVRMGLDRHHINILICAEDEAKKYTAYLRESGINVDKLNSSEDIVILFNDELLEKPSGMIFEKLSREVRSFGESAKEKGAKGINLWGETCGVLSARGRYKDCLLLERFWEESVSKSIWSGLPITAVCPFTFLPPRVEVALREFHSGTLATAQTLKLSKLQYHI